MNNVDQFCYLGNTLDRLHVATLRPAAVGRACCGFESNVVNEGIK